MSYDYSFSFGPVTPPDYSYGDALEEPSIYKSHSRASSLSSSFSQDQLCDTCNTQLMTPIKSPIRQHGPLLLPKIRPQDQTIESEPNCVKTMPLANKPRASRPSHTRSSTNPEFITHFSSASPPQSYTRSSSMSSPPTRDSLSFGHQRTSSGTSLDGQMLGRYGFPTYKQMPNFVSSVPNNQTPSYGIQQNYAITTPREPSPMRNSISYDDWSSMDGITDKEPTTTLMSYLTSPNPSPALVRQINVHIRDPKTKHFWWDIRQLRPWTSFNMATIKSNSGLLPLLKIPLYCASLPSPARTSSNPETEASLANIYTTFYAQKLNSALFLSQGPRHLLMRASSTTTGNTSEATFTSANTDDRTALIYGRGLGRVVGLVKSFDRWNTGMRVEENHKKVEYLRGLAHLHSCMREHGCRYGFILTEIELVVVRNGTEPTPVFGYMEVATIQLCEHAAAAPSTFSSYASSNTSYASSENDLDASFISDSSAQNDYDDDEAETPTQASSQPEPPKMTALLALWYLHMLARDDPLPGEITWKSEIGAPAEGTRRKCAKKDEWMPEPQLAEKRAAKRARGWIWPEEAVNRKELGKGKVVYK